MSESNHRDVRLRCGAADSALRSAHSQIKVGGSVSLLAWAVRPAAASEPWVAALWRRSGVLASAKGFLVPLFAGALSQAPRVAVVAGGRNGFGAVAPGVAACFAVSNPPPNISFQRTAYGCR